MQEQIEEKTIALAVRGTKLTARLLAKALAKLLRAMKKQHGKAVNKIYHGRQTVKQLVRQNAGVTSIEISDGNIKAFESVARKYGVDFALKKDASMNPPKWLVFFKARDADALTSAFSEFTAKTLGQGQERPSALERLRRAKELIRNHVVDRTRTKEHGGPEL